MKVVVLGVSGSGKSTVGNKLSTVLGSVFFDADDFHPFENVKKMQQGIPLVDADRKGWLETLNQKLREEENVVLACSALKPEYREQLSQGNSDLVFVYLKGDFDTIWQRHQQREGHFFTGKAMLESQFAALVAPEDANTIVIDIDQTVEEMVTEIVTKLGESA